jgi:glycosyltransferase involved in cell wall biosynthesis
MSTPAISVILPVHNGLPYLREAVESILGQSFPDFELLAIDDGSTDGSAVYLEALDDPRLRIFRRNHSGITPGLNFGLAQARADLIARMDADDIARPERLERQWHFMHDHPEVVLLGSRVQEIDGTGRLVGVVATLPEEHEAIVARFTQPRKMNPLVHPAVMFRREAALRCGGYREDFPVAEDSDLWRRLARIGRLHILAEPLLLLRKHDGNVTRAKALQSLESMLRISVSHRIWDRTGVDVLTSRPDLWSAAKQRIAELMVKLRLAEALEGRRLLKSLRDVYGRDWPRTLWMLLRRSVLLTGLGIYRRRETLVVRVTDEIAARIGSSQEQAPSPPQPFSARPPK